MPSKPDKYNVIWTETAEKDLESVILFIAKDSPANALNVLANIKKKCSNLSVFPKRGRIVPELKRYNIQQYHEILIQHWRVIYKISDKRVFVLSVIDSYRNVEDLLLDRFTHSND